MSLDSLKLQIQSRIEQMRLYRVFSKVRYLLASAFGNVRDEGIVQTAVRSINFIRYGKGVARGKDYAREKKETSKGVVYEFKNIVSYIDSDQEKNSCRREGSCSEMIIDIIIPVYNGIEYLEPLFSSVIANTTSPYRLIIIDDASPDPLVRSFLQDFVKSAQESHPDLEIILDFNRRNKGFVATVNDAMQYVQGHFVLLNTDTEVPHGWLQRLMGPIMTDKMIATTTPYTNAGEIFSFPRLAYVNPSQELIADVTFEEVDAVLADSFEAGIVFDVPTGMGFCMGVNYDVFRKLSLDIEGRDRGGIFDEVAFGRGYGEETDFCLRARAAGYRNVHVPNLFVYHKHGGSFASTEKRQLIQDHMRIIEKRYPGYNQRVKKFFDEDRYQALREFLYAKIMMGTSHDVAVIFDNTLGGGACLFADRLVQKRLDQGFSSIHIRYDHLSKKYVFSLSLVGHVWLFSLETIVEMETFLDHFDLGVIYVNELVSYPSTEEIQDYIVKLKKDHSAFAVFYVHDYFCVCPNFTLVNEKSEYCGVPDLPRDLQSCERCLLKTQTNYKMFSRNRDIVQWREMWKKFFENVDEIQAFSDASAEIVTKAYDQIVSKITIRPHDTTYAEKLLKPASKEQANSKDETLRIGVLGDISYTKGSHILCSVAKYVEREGLDVEIVLFGESSGLKKHPCVRKLGRYSLEGLPEMVAQEHIDIFFIPSIWPETFSYTTSEVIALDYPIAVFDIGAPTERVKSYNQGLILADKSPKNILSAIRIFLDRM